MHSNIAIWLIHGTEQNGEVMCPEENLRCTHVSYWRLQGSALTSDACKSFGVHALHFSALVTAKLCEHHVVIAVTVPSFL
jgi:hypothetical protein